MGRGTSGCVKSGMAGCVYGDMGLRDGDVGMQDTGRRDVELGTWGRMIGVIGT